MLFCLMVTVRTAAGHLGYRQYSFHGFTVSATGILVLRFICLAFAAFLVWYFSIRIAGKRKHGCLLAMAAVSALFLGSGWMLDRLNVDLDAYALPVEYNYSYIKEHGGKEGKLVLTVNEGGIVSLPCRENRIPLVRYSRTEPFDVGDGLVFTAALQMKDGTTTQAYEGAYNEESDAVEIYVPELETDYGYGVLVVTATNGQESTQTRVTVEESEND
ncbi:MAG: hypothetical protein LUE65_01295 [Clostridiales bacterium]|nr:hypothetical protein [Clostridiales bacterium]